MAHPECTLCAQCSMHRELVTEAKRTCSTCTKGRSLEAAVGSLCEVVRRRQRHLELHLQHRIRTCRTVLFCILLTSLE